MRRSLCILAIALCLMPVVLVPQEGHTQEGDGEKVEVEPITVIGQPIQPQGTGTLKLESSSPTSSRLGLTLREIPASVDVVDQGTMLERGHRSISEAIQSATGVTVGDSPAIRRTFLCGDSPITRSDCYTTASSLARPV